MKIKQLGSNRTELESGNLTILFSYETPVAVWDRNIGDYFVTEKTWSNTTSKHVSAWIRSHGREKADVEKKSQEWFDRLVSVCSTPTPKSIISERLSDV